MNSYVPLALSAQLHIRGQASGVGSGSDFVIASIDILEIYRSVTVAIKILVCAKR